MVEPIGKKEPLSPPSPTEKMSFPSAFASLSSTLTSLKHSESFFVQPLRMIARFIKWMFDHTPPKSPEIKLPENLQRDDPFIQHLFVFSSEGVPNLRSTRKYEVACHIFQTLGTGGPLHWLRHKWQLEKWEKEVIDSPGDPFEFLYFLTHTLAMTQSMHSFEKIAKSSTKGGICYLVGRKPWDEFLAKQSESFTLRGKEEMIPGFCQLLKLDEEKVSTWFKERDWKALILHTLKKRKNYFDIK